MQPIKYESKTRRHMISLSMNADCLKLLNGYAVAHGISRTELLQAIAAKRKELNVFFKTLQEKYVDQGNYKIPDADGHQGFSFVSDVCKEHFMFATSRSEEFRMMFLLLLLIEAKG